MPSTMNRAMEDWMSGGEWDMRSCLNRWRWCWELAECSQPGDDARGWTLASFSPASSHVSCRNRQCSVANETLFSNFNSVASTLTTYVVPSFHHPDIGILPNGLEFSLFPSVATATDLWPCLLSFSILDSVWILVSLSPSSYIFFLLFASIGLDCWRLAALLNQKFNQKCTLMWQNSPTQQRLGNLVVYWPIPFFTWWSLHAILSLQDQNVVYNQSH